LQDAGKLKRAILTADGSRAGAIVNLVPLPHSGAEPTHGFEVFHDGGLNGLPLRVRDVLPYPGCPEWGTWRLARHLADLTNRDYLYSLRRSAVFDAGTAARRIIELAARDGYDALAFLAEKPRPGKELQWAWAVPPTSLPTTAQREAGAGSQPVKLVKFPYEVAGLRDAVGRLMFSEDSRALSAGIDAWLGEMDAEPMVAVQKWAGSDSPRAFALPIGGEWCPCKLRSGHGTIEIGLPEGLAIRLADLIDDQEPREGRQPRRKLVYEWPPGLTAAAFVGKLRSEMDRAYDMLSAASAGMN
jgi:hypothetical protein